MQALEKRIATLEQASRTDLGAVIFIVFDTPGLPDTELHKLSTALGDDECQQWTREPGESEQDFRDRASKEVRRNPYGVGMLLQTD